MVVFHKSHGSGGVLFAKFYPNHARILFFFLLNNPPQSIGIQSSKKLSKRIHVLMSQSINYGSFNVDGFVVLVPDGITERLNHWTNSYVLCFFVRFDNVTDSIMIQKMTEIVHYAYYTREVTIIARRFAHNSCFWFTKKFIKDCYCVLKRQVETIKNCELGTIWLLR